MELSDRKKKILSSVVDRYIVTGEPVGSKVICGDLAVSSATVRNEMSELSEMGYLEQPHTSAGRIPSQMGLRYYVDNLMTRYVISDAERFNLENRFNDTTGEPVDILREAMKTLSDITGCAAVASTPYDSHSTIRRVDLVPLSMTTALVVLLSSTGMVKSRICRCDHEVDIETADLFYNIAGSQFIGHSANELTLPRIQTMVASLGDKALAMTPLLVTLSELAVEASMRDVLVDGQSKLLNFRELDDDVYDIFEFLKHSSSLANILSRGKDIINVSIGSENRIRSLENAGIIFSKYNVGGKPVGAVGIIGPTRLDYSRIIPNISYVSEIVGRVLSETLEE